MLLFILFVILMIGVFGKLLALSFKAAWGLTKILFHLVFLPVVLIGMVIAGLISLAVPILAIIGLLALLGGSRSHY